MDYLILMVVAVALIILAIFITGIIIAAKTERKKPILQIFLHLSTDARSMLVEIFKLHEQKQISDINRMVEKAKFTTTEILTTLRPQNRPKELSAGEKFDLVTWTVYQQEFLASGYSEASASLLAGVFLFDLDNVL